MTTAFLCGRGQTASARMEDARIRNALTGFVHDDKLVGTKAELEFYRVMPEGGTTKLFFAGPDQYALWRVQRYVDSIDAKLSEAQRDQLLQDPFDFPPVAFRTDFLSRRSGN